MKLVVAIVVSAIISARAQEPLDSATIEPPILPGNLVPEQAQPQQADIPTLERKLTRARESAAGAERLVRIGVLAKVEGENRALRVVRIEAELANAQFSAAKTELERKQDQVAAGEISANELEKTKTQVSEAQRNAEAATSRLKKAEFAAAALNLERQRKLLALGSGRKSSVKKAEETLAELKSANGQ